MIREYKLDDNIVTYRQLYDIAQYKTIYHHLDYLLAEEAAEDYPLYYYIYEQGSEWALLVNVKRRLNDLEVFNGLIEEYYDVAAPHEYSGIMASKKDKSLFVELYTEFTRYCETNNIVDYFIRFNPYCDDYQAANGYDVQLSCNQVWIDCSLDKIESAFSKEKQRKLKQAYRYGLTCEQVAKDIPNKRIFMELYKKSMDRLKADRFFYFSDGYFNTLLGQDYAKLYFVSEPQNRKIVSASIVLEDKFNETLYYHLSAREIDYEKMRPVELLIYTFAMDAQNNGMKRVHLAGGHESLLSFKSEFSDKRIEYYIGSKIFLPIIYNMGKRQIINKLPWLKDSQFFPIYRAEGEEK